MIRTPTLLDQHLPQYEFRGVVSMRVAAPPTAILQAASELTAAEMPIATWLSTLRYLPARLFGHAPSPTAARVLFDELRAKHNVILGEDPEREVVFGVIGRLHHMLDQKPVPISNAEAFASFAEPNHEKLAMSLRVVQDSRGERLVFEHRTHALDRRAYFKFALYWWLLIKWGSALMGWMLLRAIKRRAEITPRTEERKHNWAWLAVPLFAIANGALRDFTYGQAMPRALAHSLSVIPLLAAIFAWAFYLERRWPLRDRAAAVRVGAVWLLLTLGFEFGFGALRGEPLSQLLAAYDVTRGHLWPLVPLAMAIAPYIARKPRRIGKNIASLSRSASAGR